jgi:hypothetical protein
VKEDDQAEHALRAFLASVDGLAVSAVVEALKSERRRPLTLRELNVHPDFLLAVANGSWPASRAVLARRASRAAKRLSHELVPRRDRKSFADALEAAALAVLMRAGAKPVVPEELLRRMESPWSRAVSAAGVQAR